MALLDHRDLWCVVKRRSEGRRVSALSGGEERGERSEYKQRGKQKNWRAKKCEKNWRAKKCEKRQVNTFPRFSAKVHEPRTSKQPNAKSASAAGETRNLWEGNIERFENCTSANK
jgi:hypothetical protein